MASQPLRLVQRSPADRRRAGHESRAVEGDHASLKLWLRLLTASTEIEAEVRRRLRLHFGTTLPRFDYLSQLYRFPEGLRMNELSRCLMVTGGSITGLTDQLQAEGLVQRSAAPDDRRANILRLTSAGRQAFEAMAAAHERWAIELLGGLNATERRTLHGLLGRLRLSVGQQTQPPESTSTAENP